MYTLRHNLKVHVATPLSVPIQNAVANLKRDMDNMLWVDYDQQISEIHFISDPALLAEAFHIRIDINRIEIRAADELGFIYALYYLSEKFLGVNPMWFWNDQEFEKRSHIEIPCGIYQSEPLCVRYRG